MSYSDRLRKEDWVVRGVSLDIARGLVEKHHYAKGGSNTRTYLHGLYPKGSFWDAECVGVAWWIPPTKSSAMATYPTDWNGVLSLSRLVMVPGVPKNACTFLLSRSAKMIPRERWPCLVTYADEWRGHTGGIYRASGWKYLGLTNAEATYTVNGVMRSRKAGDRTKTHSEMMALGANFEGKHAKHKYVLIRHPYRGIPEP